MMMLQLVKVELILITLYTLSGSLGLYHIGLESFILNNCLNIVIS